MARSFLGIDLPHLPDRIEPVQTLGYEKLSESEKVIANQLSIVEQRSILAVQLAQASLSIIMALGKILGIVIVLILVLEGPRIYRVWTDWLGVRVAVNVSE